VPSANEQRGAVLVGSTSLQPVGAVVTYRVASRGLVIT
jgi:hypothetical protein